MGGQRGRERSAPDETGVLRDGEISVREREGNKMKYVKII